MVDNTSRYPVELIPGYRIHKDDNYSIRILFEITLLCNQSCEYCCNNVSPRKKGNVDLQKFVKSIKELRDRVTDGITIEMMGGEPTIVPGFKNFILELQSISDVRCVIYTNLSQDIEMYNSLLASGAFISATWHSTETDKVNKTFVQKAMMLDKRYFDMQNVELIVILEDNNFENSLKTFEQLHQMFPWNVNCSLLCQNLDGTIQYIKDRRMYTKEQMDAYQKYLGLSKIPRGPELIVRYSDSSEEEYQMIDYMREYGDDFFMWRCQAGRKFLFIDCDGNIYPCSSQYEPVGNVNDGFIPLNDHDIICRIHKCPCLLDVWKRKIQK